MDSFYAPLVKGNNDLFEAISRMAAVKSPALVVNIERQHRLFTSKTVFDSYSKKEMNTCSQLWNEEGFRIEDISDFDLGLLQSIPMRINPRLPNLLEDILNYKKLDYGFLFPESESYLAQMVQVITRREDYKYAIVGTNTICVCDSPHRHLAYDPKKDGQDCEKDPPHKYKCTSSK